MKLGQLLSTGINTTDYLRNFNMNQHTKDIYAIIEENFKTDYKNLLRISENKLGNLWGEDAVMDTYAAVLKAAPRLHAEYDVKYLMRAALHNRIKDYLSDRIDTEEVEEEHLYGGNVEDKWKHIDTAKTALVLIDKYKEPMRTALYLSCIEGVALREVSSIVEIPQTTIHRHVKSLRERLDGISE